MAIKIGHALGGFLLGAGGVGLLTSMDAVAKSLGASLPIFEVVFVRYLGAALWLALFLALTDHPWPKRQNLKRHVLRGGLVAVTATLLFYGVTHLPLAVAAALAMTAPVYISFLGIVFLKEPATSSLLAAVLLGVAGSLFIMFGGDAIPTTGSSSILAWGAAVLAPVSYAATLVLLKHHSSDEGAAAMTLAQSAIAALIILPVSVPFFVTPPFSIWGHIMLIGLLGALGFLCLIGGLKRLPASVFSIIDYTALLWAAALGFLFFHEVPVARIWIGGGMIIAACILGVWSARKQQINLRKPT